MRRVIAGLALISTLTSVGYAQTKPAPKFGILDNSFLVEEAFNQEAGIFQNIFVFTRAQGGVWQGSFTQEWPVMSIRHQVSFAMPFTHADGNGTAGDLALNYRFQLWEESGGRPAFAPRITVMLPTSAESHWEDGVSWQFNLPFSKQIAGVYFHANAGGTFDADGTTPFLAGSAIVAVSPMFNVMFEALVQSAPGDGDEREVVRIFSPGVRAGWNFGSTQLVAGIAVPITRGAERNTAVLGYLSYELPFRK
jgi:hypothetical protein